MHTEFQWENQREGDHLEDPGVDGEDNIKVDFRDVVWWHTLDRSGSG